MCVCVYVYHLLKRSHAHANGFKLSLSQKLNH